MESKENNFVHLHVHSDNSLMESCATVDRVAEKAKAFEMKALAITDSGNMSGVPSFVEACRKIGIKPIIGQEFSIFSQDGADKKWGCKIAKSFKIVLLCQNQEGYKNICALSSHSTKSDCIDWPLLQKHNAGLIFLSGGTQGELGQLLLANKSEEAKKFALKCKEIFGKVGFYIEVQNHGTKEEEIVLKKSIKLSRELGIPLVATNNVHYINKDDAKAQEILYCIKQKRTVYEPHENICNGEGWHFRNQEKMRSAFADCSDAIENTAKIADACNFELKEVSRQELLENIPRVKLPKEFKTHGEDWQSDQNDYLKFLVRKGLKKRYQKITRKIQGRADSELSVIFDKKLSGYFLFFWELVSWTKAHYGEDAVGLGRGPAPGSLVNYALGITDIEPLENELLFERFINPERDMFPDIDIDVDFDFHDEIIKHVFDLYGEDCVAKIKTFGFLKAKNCISDVGRTLCYDIDEIIALKKGIPDRMNAKIQDTLEKPTSVNPDNGKLMPYTKDPRCKELFDLAMRLEGVKRFVSVHACGITVSNKKLRDLLPLGRNPQTGQVYTQYTPNELEQRGLLKYDILGFKTLSEIRNIEELVNKKIKIKINDKKTFDLFKSGDTDGVFMFESQGMKNYLRQLEPTSLSDLTALHALYRPGSIDFIPAFIAAKANQEIINYIDSSLKGVLNETYGLIVYQEQVMQILHTAANYSLAEADLIRRELGKRQVYVIEKRRENFCDRAATNGYSDEGAQKIFDSLCIMAPYAFNKSHAFSYTTLAYRMAYLKAHYPKEFAQAREKYNCFNDVEA